MEYKFENQEKKINYTFEDEEETLALLERARKYVYLQSTRLAMNGTDNTAYIWRGRGIYCKKTWC